MINGMNGLISLDPVLHLTAGPILRIRSPLSSFTHVFHSRYASKEDLAAYAVHPTHVAMIKANQPICEDVMAVDWVFDHAPDPQAGSAMRVTLFKLKEGVGEGVRGEILGSIKGLKDGFSCGENISPDRAKGFSIAALAVFQGVNEMEAVDAEFVVDLCKDKLQDYLDSFIVVDFLLPSP
ncbi:Dabb domain-containing protein [Cephalotus follicularis]|uniref:Dabb domain-containing protein n=1 Tax=Cephalotus follicularis TaxID=3775 RepID=A0A1Q3D910_CEPFO|nr:Dabb domain-containing protein [Cephalotus follicularis]